MTFVSDLEPRAVWRHFDALLAIPRPSKHEAAARRHVEQLAERHGLAHESDAAGNLLVRKPASAGHERAPIVVLQSHLDMVTEKNSDVAHDFSHDPIQPRLADGWLTATGTTLGADNGIGVAAMLAMIEGREAPHGPLELLFTVDEETGLTGAAELAPGWLAGRLLLNLDSEEEGLLTIGCAGGAESRLELPLVRGPVPSGMAALEVRLSGLRGGHSGIDIHLQRGNAVQLLARALWAASLGDTLRIAEFQGGNKHNAIPREAGATLVVEAGAKDRVRAALERELAAVASELRVPEPGLRAAVTVDGASPDTAWDSASTTRTLALLVALPHGVVATSHDIPGLVETSVNLAAVAECGGVLSVLLSRRSSVAGALSALGRRVRAVGTLAGARVDERTGYPAWKPDPGSRLLAVVRATHETVLGRAAKVGALHAGLECGIIGEKHPGMEMVSIGPQIEFPHSPDERVRVETVGRFYRLLTATLEALARG